MVTAPDYDILIIGGGINGAGIARDAAGRGLKVALFEQGDLAQGTSSASTKLIHGGLRYLEHYEFRLVRESLIEREVLWQMAPHIIWPLRFVLPYQKGLRPPWLIRLGLLLYDHIGGRKLLRATRTIDLARHEAGKPLKDGYSTAFEYSDCWVVDSRLVLLNARDAAQRGAHVATRARVVRAIRSEGHWQCDVQHADGRTQSVSARILVNAAGPWVGDVLSGVVPSNTAAAVRMVQGSHIVVPRIFEHDRAYIFQNADNRIVFAIPYERDFTLIGTTDRDYSGDPACVQASEDEIGYLCAAASEYFARPVRHADVVWTYSGVRPLYDDGASKAQEATRDYVLHLDDGEAKPPLLSIFGGKITTYRRLAEAVLEKLAPHLPAEASTKAGWTKGACLPGGDFPYDGYRRLVDALQARHPFLAPAHCERLVRSYGTEAMAIVGDAADAAGLGQHFGADLYACEIDHMIAKEWVRTGEDALWRRSKLGLHLDVVQAAAVQAYIAAKVDAAAGNVSLTMA